MAQITFDNKVDLVTSGLADINKVTASDMNAIKLAVNTNDNEKANAADVYDEYQYNSMMDVSNASDGSFINYNSTTQILTIPNDTTLWTANGDAVVNVVGEKSVDITAISSPVKVVYNTSTKDFRPLSVNTALDDLERIFCFIRKSNPDVSINCGYAIDGVSIRQAITKDTTPTEGSTNAVESGGAKTYIDTSRTIYNGLNEKILTGQKTANFKNVSFTQGYYFGSSGAFIPTGAGTAYGNDVPLPIIGGIDYEYSSLITGNASLVFLKEDGSFHSTVTGTTLAANSYIVSPEIDVFFVNVTALISDVDSNNVFFTAQDDVSKINQNTNLYNATNSTPLASGYYNDTNVLSAVPVNVRKLGLRITYQTNSATWRTRRYIGDDLVGWTTSTNWLDDTINFYTQKKLVAINNRETKVIVFDSVAKTVTFPVGIDLIDNTIGRAMPLTAERVVSMGGFNQGLLYFDNSDNLIKFRGITNIDETEALFNSYHKLDNLYVIGIVNSISSGNTLPSLNIDANFYSVDGNIFGDGRNYVDTKIAAVDANFNELISHSEWYQGDVTKLTNDNVKSVIPAIKDVWFEFINGKPSWWDDSRMRFVTIFRPDYTLTPTDDDTLFQFRFTSFDETFNEIHNFFRYEFASYTELAHHSKVLTINGERIRINIFADISAYSSTLPVPRDDTSFMLWGNLKSSSIYKEALDSDISAHKIWYGGNEIFVSDLYDVNLYKRGLSTKKEIKTISLSAKTNPLLNDTITTPYDPSALVQLRNTLRDNSMPTYKYSTDKLSLNYAEAGDKVWLGIDWSKFEDKKFGIELDVKRKKLADITNTTVNVMTIGASSTDSGLASYTKLLFEDNSLIFNGIGTKPDYFGTNGEGRGGWSYSMYTGISSLGATNDSIVPLAAGGATSTLYENPFLYIASAQQKIDHPDWCFRRSTLGSRAELTYTTDPIKTGDFYIFDFVQYLSDRSVSTPDIITLQLGMNDYYSVYWGNDQATINCALSLEIMYTQIRLAYPLVPINVISYMPRFTFEAGYNSVNGLAIKNYVDVLNTFFTDKADSNFHIINAHCLMNPDYVFDLQEGDKIDNSGNSTSELTLMSPSDGIHFQKNGYIEFSKVVGNFILNQMS